MCRHCVVVLQTLTGDVQALGGEGGAYTESGCAVNVNT